MADKPYALTDDEGLSAVAQRRGYDSVRAHLLALVARDAAEHGEEPPNVREAEGKDGDVDPVESFRKAWSSSAMSDWLTTSYA